MSLSFTINQMELFALSEQRYHTTYFALRDVAGLKPGVHWSTNDSVAFASQLAEARPPMEVAGGATIDEYRLYACVHLRWTIFLLAVKAMKEGEMKVSEVRKNRAKFITCLSQVQW